jgi:hypothetical protein
MDRKELCAMFLDGGEGQDAPLLAPDVAARVAKAFIAPARAGAQAAIQDMYFLPGPARLRLMKMSKRLGDAYILHE